MEILFEDTNNPYGVHPNLWRWNPVIDGPAFTRFLDSSKLPDEARETLRSFTPRVLGQAVDPGSKGTATGLVIGRVQSGKTNSFLGLAALASDNGYRLIVILGGTKNILKDQTYKQVVQRLSKGDRGWKAIDFDPDIDQSEFESKLRAAASSLDSRTVVVTILKRTRASSAQRPEPQGIDRLATFIENSDYRDIVRDQPVLIIDDEADEAGLDTNTSARRRGRDRPTTPTASSIHRLRGLFRRLLFVQYTATPQANLLVALQDQLSADFCELLPPGADYCGAADFFPPGEPYFREIPAPDIAAVDNRDPVPPDTLRDALLLFYVGAALEDYLAGPQKTPAPRSMLVHPGRTVASHSTALRWVNSFRTHLLDVLDVARSYPDGVIANDLSESIQSALTELGRTVSTAGVEPLAIAGHIQARVADTSIRLINSRKQLDEELDWDDEACWIFVGGDVLQRGFAIQGLTVTWMPRSSGNGQIDVLMQRGRFFGYRRPFLQYCRVWLPKSVHDDFYALFADNEKALWRSLGEHLRQGDGLKEWRRNFWIDQSRGLRLCRTSTQWFRLRAQSMWATQQWIPSPDSHKEISEAAHNAQLIEALLSAAPQWDPAWVPSTGQASDFRQHFYTHIRLADVQSLMESYRFFGEDAAAQIVVRDAVAALLERDSSARAIMVNMRPRTQYVRRQRGATPSIEQLQAGRSREQDPSRANYYPGDRSFRPSEDGLPSVTEDLLTIQVFRPSLERLADGSVLTGAAGYLYGGCPLLAVYLPESIRNYRRESGRDRE